MKLKQIAGIRSGYQFRGRVEPDPRGRHRVIQMSDIDDQGRLCTANLVTVSLSTGADPCLTEVGDVLFLSRGRRPLAAAITEPLDDAIAAGYFFLLRPKVEGVLPEYLAWNLNQPPTQARLRSLQRGAHMPIIAKADLREVEVALPPMAVQEKVVELDRLSRREEELAANLQSKRAQLARAVAWRAVGQWARLERNLS